MLAITSPQRSPLAPNLATFREQGYPELDIYIWAAIVAPAGTPRDVVLRLNSEFAKALTAPDVAQRLPALGIDPVGGTPEQYADQIRNDLPRFKKLVTDTGATID